MIDRLADDKRIGLNKDQLRDLVESASNRTGAADSQVDEFVKKIDSWILKYPDAKKYKPPSIL